MELNGNASRFGKFFCEVVFILREKLTFDLKCQEAITAI